MSILILVLISSAIVLTFLFFYVSKENFRTTVEAPKYEMLSTEQQFRTPRT